MYKSNWEVNSFLEKFPEFQGAGEPLIRRAIDDAERQVDQGQYRNVADAAVGLIAAIDLAGSPFATSQKLITADKMTEYEKRLASIKLQVRTGCIVL